MLRRDGWILEAPALVSLFERLMNHGTPLGEYVQGRIFTGVKTGLNKAFVIDEARRDALIEEDPRSKEIIKPWLRGRDIRRWRAESSGLYIIFTSRGVNIDQYPAVKDHLKWFKVDLENRATARLHPWYELQQPQEGIHHLFAHSKIVWPDITLEARFAYDATGSYMDMTCFAFPAESAWMLAIMNSGLVEFLLCQVTSALRGGYLRPKRQYTTRLPIVTPDAEEQAGLETLASEILHIESPDLVCEIEREIDAIAFEVYGLTAPERKLVLDWLGERREVLGVDMQPDWRKLNSLQASAGAWKGSIDGEQLKQDIRASRRLSTRPVPRL